MPPAAVCPKLCITVTHRSTVYRENTHVDFLDTCTLEEKEGVHACQVMQRLLRDGVNVKSVRVLYFRVY